MYVTLKDWSERGRSEDLKTIYQGLTKKLAEVQDANALVLVPPPIQGLGLSGVQMQLELTDGW
jgi:HAE1 family hydrophobic/amphiphilic exporter-1